MIEFANMEEAVVWKEQQTGKRLIPVKETEKSLDNGLKLRNTYYKQVDPAEYQMLRTFFQNQK